MEGATVSNCHRVAKNSSQIMRASRSPGNAHDHGTWREGILNEYYQGSEPLIASVNNWQGTCRVGPTSSIEGSYPGRLGLDDLSRMYLMYHLDGEGNRVYTLKKMSPSGEVTKSAHPARFSPDDKYSRHRVTLKRRFGILLTQLPSKPY